MPIVQVDPQHPEPEVLEAAATAIRGGGIVAYPTETVYGLGVHALNPEAVQRLSCVKGRAPGKAFSVLVSDRRMLSGLVQEITEAASLLIEAFWPGPLTLVFDAVAGLPAVLLGDGETIAIRISSHPVAMALVSQCGCPITATSANRSGMPSARCAEEVAQAVGNGVDLVLDGGASPAREPSTVVDVASGHVKVLRPGPISTDAVLRAVRGQAAEARG